MPMTQTRRRFLATLSMVGAAGLVRPAAAADGPLETTTVRLVNDRSICIAPEYVAEELLRAEGFTDIRYVEAPGSQQVGALLQGELDFANFFPGGNIPQIDAGAPIVVLAGIHVGCFELKA
jgi:NitT/TauT family transport system substrate-binding protein